MAKLASKSIDFPEFGVNGLLGENYFKAQEDALTKLCEASDKIDFNNPKVSLKGAILAIPFADGRAHYVVTSDKPLTLAHIPFCDAWHLPAAHIRGINRSDILDHLRQRAHFAALFSGKNKKV